jgi:anti-sigma regulatory factor (Ser/Thr protein kinase)
MCRDGQRTSQEIDVKLRWVLAFGAHVGEGTLRGAAEVVPFLDDLLAALAGMGYPSRDCAGVRLALEEAIVNGLRPGNGGDPTRRVRVRYHVGFDGLLAELEHEGPGYDPRRVPDPTTPENPDQPRGRGLLLTRHTMTWLRLSARGNCLTLCKYRSA